MIFWSVHFFNIIFLRFFFRLKLQVLQYLLISLICLLSWTLGLSTEDCLNYLEDQLQQVKLFYFNTHPIVCPIHQSQHKVLLHVYLLALAHLEYPVHCSLNPACFMQQMRPAKSLCTYINNKMSQINTGKYTFIAV